MKKLTTSEGVNELLHAPASSAALGAAIESGLLWLLAGTPMDEVSVARKLGIPQRRCQYWLQMLECLGILKKDRLGYQPSSLAYESILNTRSQESWQHLALDERERGVGVHQLALYISEPGSIYAAQGLTSPRDYVTKMRADPQRARDFTRTLYELHRYLGTAMVELLDMNGVHSMLDVGGGSGVVSLALLHEYPELTATVLDIENVCIAGREIAAENGLSDRIRYLPLDFTQQELPDGVDLVLKCDCYIFGEALFHRIWNALNPGGRLVLIDRFSPTETTASLLSLEWLFLDSLENPDAHILTLEQVKEQLTRTGFELMDNDISLPYERVLIQARKSAGIAWLE